MLNSFKISKGHNLLIEGTPEKNIFDIESPSSIMLHPTSINGTKTKLLINEGEYVKVGSPIYFDKRNPDVHFVSTCSGKIDKIIFGERRIVKAIHINNDKRYDSINLDTKISRESLLNSGLWTCIRQKPFSKILKSDISPKSFFLSAMPTEPFAINLEYLFNNEDNYLQRGIDVLKEIFDCDINLISTENSIFKNLKNANHYSFNQLHPAGNVGIQIHHIDPIKNADDVRCYLSMQDLNRIGKFYSKKDYPVFKFIAVGGNGSLKPGYYKYLIGTPISYIINNRYDEKSRIISGDILSGKETQSENSINYFDEILSLIKISEKRQFLGWLSPGFNKYSLSNTFLSRIFKKHFLYIDTKLNGSVRSIIPMGTWDRVLPMNILPEFLIKNILVEDIDMMENLGIYECSPEDFSLCSFVCQSKVEVSSIIEKGLKIMDEQA